MPERASQQIPMNERETVPATMTFRRVSLIGALFVAIGPISMALYTPAMTEIVDAFGSTDAMVKLTLTFYFGGFAFAQLFAGPLSDAFGRRPITIVFMAIYLVGSIAALFSPTVGFLIAARFIQGVGAAAGQAIARAVVRDLFDGQQSASIMNLIGIILAAGPALAPTIGGFTLELAGWQAIFVMMAGMAIMVTLVAVFALKETVVPDPSRFKPRVLARTYREMLGNRHFLTTTGIIAGAIGAFYAQATFLPFIMMEEVGLSASQFGMAMIMQSGSFLLGSIVMRIMIRRMSAYRLVPFGLAFVGIGSVLLTGLLFLEPTFLRVMGPVAFYGFGIALIMPSMLTASLAPFPKTAGAASSLNGFAQMGGGLAMGTIGAALGDPQIAMGLIIPLMGAFSIFCYVLYRSNPHLAEPEPLAVTVGPSSTGRALRSETNRRD